MTRRTSSVFAALIAAAIAAPVMAEPRIPMITDIPPGHTLFARADSLAALQAATKPTLVYDKTEFLWTARAADGARHFTHATAYALHHNGKLEYVLLNPSTTQDAFRARFTVAADATVDAQAALTRSHAGIVAQHKTLGTLYQVRIDRAPAGRVDEERILVLHSPARGWEFITALRADYTSGDGTLRTRVAIEAVRWTGLADRPLAIDFHATSTLRAGNLNPIVMHDTYTRAGALPLASSTNRARYVVVGKGDTLSNIAQRLAPWQSSFSKSTVSTLAMQRQLLALNAGVDANVIRLGSKLTVPDLNAAPAGAPAAPVVVTRSPRLPTPTPPIVAADFPQ